MRKAVRLAEEAKRIEQESLALANARLQNDEFFNQLAEDRARTREREWRELQEELEQTNETAEDISSTLLGGLESAIFRAGELNDVFASILRQLGSIIFQATVSGPISELFSTAISTGLSAKGPMRFRR